MKSTIRVDFAGVNQTDTFQPVIRVHLQDSEDTRDGLLKTFFQALGGESSWLKVHFDFEGDFGKKITIYPVRPNDLANEEAIIHERIRRDKLVGIK